MVHDDLSLFLEFLDLVRQLDLLAPQLEKLVPNSLVARPRFLGQRSVRSILSATGGQPSDASYDLRHLVDGRIDLVELLSKLDGPTADVRQDDLHPTRERDVLVRLLQQLLP